MTAQPARVESESHPCPVVVSLLLLRSEKDCALEAGQRVHGRRPCTSPGRSPSLWRGRKRCQLQAGQCFRRGREHWSPASCCKRKASLPQRVWPREDGRGTRSPDRRSRSMRPPRPKGRGVVQSARCRLPAPGVAGPHSWAGRPAFMGRPGCRRHRSSDETCRWCRRL